MPYICIVAIVLLWSGLIFIDFLSNLKTLTKQKLFHARKTGNTNVTYLCFRACVSMSAHILRMLLALPPGYKVLGQALGHAQVQPRPFY